VVWARVDGSGRGCERGLPGCSRGSTGWGPSGVSPHGRKRDAVVGGELEYRSRCPDVHVRSDVRALAVLEKKLPL
jgi:hypothetical protein